MAREFRYLRERGDEEHTSLKEYLDAIFLHNDFVYNETLSADVAGARGATTRRRFRPDARSESLSLILEVDGVDHYKENRVVIGDAERDNWFRGLGYRVVRIPYWVQLTNAVAALLFDVDVKTPLCTLKRSFYDTPDHGVSTAIGSMSELGRVRFVNEAARLPGDVQWEICDDLLACVDVLDAGLDADVVIPRYVFERWASLSDDVKSHPLAARLLDAK